MRTRSHGFTLIGLAIIVTILGLLLFIVLTQSAQNGKHQGNAQRRADVNSILTAIDAYAKQHDGKVPEGITSESKMIASTTGTAAINLCSALVPAYLTTIPLDPGTGLAVPVGSKCSEKDSRYSSGYTVQLTSDKKVRVNAPGAEGDEAIFATN
jgi:type II secretory pathway pseudopilin PulG